MSQQLREQQEAAREQAHALLAARADLERALRDAIRGERAREERGDQQQGRQRRIDERAGENPGQAQLHGVTSLSPSWRPERISTFPIPALSRVSPGCTTTSSPLASRT